MTYEEYERIIDKHGETYDLLNDWENVLEATKNLLNTVQWNKDSKNFQKLEDMTAEILDFVKGHMTEIKSEINECEEVMSTSEFKATEKKYWAA